MVSKEKTNPEKAEEKRIGEPNFAKSASHRAHSIFEIVSTRSSLLKTNPFPFRKFSTFRNVIKASSDSGAEDLSMLKEKNINKQEIKTITAKA
jgi:hypothetical protein